MLADLASTDLDFVVIGSSALAIQGWEIVPGDLDLLVRRAEVDGVRQTLKAERPRWAHDGDALRLECETDSGPVDIYVEVSGRLTYDEVAGSAKSVPLEGGPLTVQVGSVQHVRDMRAAAGRIPADETVDEDVGGGASPLVIAIDGPAGAGKSTVTRALAERIGFTYLDTGAMYRCVTLAVLGRRADTDDQVVIGRIANSVSIEFQHDRVMLDGQDVTTLIRAPQITDATPHVAAYPEVRQAMVRQQRNLFAKGDGFVAEGRDITTVVAPDAPLKIFLTASPEERATRRSAETDQSYAEVLASLEERDQLDSAREVSALRIADDAVVVDTTGRTVDDVVDEIALLARQRGIL
jgi:cytidylate kinase